MARKRIKARTRSGKKGTQASSSSSSSSPPLFSSLGSGTLEKALVLLTPGREDRPEERVKVLKDVS